MARRLLSLALCLAALFLCIGLSTQKKVSVSEVSFDSSVEDVQWAGNNHQTVLLKSAKGKLYRSLDGGRTWNEITDELRSLSGQNGFVVDSFAVNPINKDIILVTGTERSHFISEDSGKTFRKLKQKSPIHTWQFHPKNPRWALLSTWTDACTKTRTSTDDVCNHLLFVTTDLGQSFQLVASYVVQFSWGDPILKLENRIFFTHHRSKQGDQPRYGGWTRTVDLSYSDNFGKKVKTVVHRGNKFLISNGYLFVAKLADPVKQTVNLMVSLDGGDTWNMSQLPFDLQEKSYTVLDTSEGAVMIHVNHGEASKTGTGNVYISDAKGQRFSLSLPGNVRSSSGECEFDKVLSLDGVYIANFKDDPDNVGSQKQMEAKQTAEDVEAEEEAGKTGVDKKRGPGGKKNAKNEDQVRTVISFDKGAVWSYLRAPSIDSQGKKINCSPDKCWLHLHGITNFHNYAPFYSVENAVGLVMGTGNVGPHLRYEPDEMNTYLSRDGGLTWIEAHKGAFIYEFGDHGGLIVMADDLRKTNQVVFSWNEGQSWYDFQLGYEAMEVDNIVIEPNSSSVQFLLYGTRDGVGYLYHLDFATLSEQQCKGVWSADSVSSDYESWTPTDGRTTDACILGRQMTYTRRKQSSECFNGQDFVRPNIKKNCVCTQEDYECEMGFTRKVGSLECRPEDPNLTAPYCTSSNFFYMEAYRKIPGDTCEGGWAPIKVAVPCPQNSPFSRGATTVLFVILLVVVLLGGMTYVSSSEKFKHLFTQYGFESYKNVKYSALGKGASESAVDNMPGAFGDDFGEDEHEDDAPTLMNLTATSRVRDTSSKAKEKDVEMDRNLARRHISGAVDGQGNSLVPRLPPPGTTNKLTGKNSDEDLDLL